MKSISGPSSEGRLQVILWAVTGPVRPAVPVMENWAVGGPLLAVGDGDGDETALGRLDGIEADGPGVTDEPGTADGELLQAARTRPKRASGTPLRQPPGRMKPSPEQVGHLSRRGCRHACRRDEPTAGVGPVVQVEPVVSLSTMRGPLAATDAAREPDGCAREPMTT